MNVCFGLVLVAAVNLRICALCVVVAMANPRLMMQPGQQEDTFFYHIGDGYYYHRNSVYPHTVYFKCAKYEGTGCKGRAKYTRRTGFQHMQRHTCRRDRLYAEEMRLYRIVLERCRRPEAVTFRRIINEERRRFVSLNISCWGLYNCGERRGLNLLLCFLF